MKTEQHLHRCLECRDAWMCLDEGCEDRVTKLCPFHQAILDHEKEKRGIS